MSGIQTKDIVKYAVLPGIVPRVGALFSSGFAYVAFLMAQIYGMVRLLPAGHPYLNPKNTGRYGIRHVIAESANSIVISRKNIDQLVIFVLMLTAITLLALQLGTLVLSLLFGPAIAGSIFATPNPDGDIAFMLLDQVFGVGDGTVANNFFNSCVANTGIACPDQLASVPFPWPFHIALRNLFRFYSLAILIIGTLIFLYFVLVVVVETAATGSPFGQRFQNVWVPIRLVVAIGLLIPLQFGYNSGQYVTFFAAKYGSGLATQTWNRYNAAIAGRMGAKANPLGESENLIAAPSYPDAAPIAMALSMVHTCAFATYFSDSSIVKTDPAGGGTAAGATTGPDNKHYYLPVPEDSGAYGDYIDVADNPRGVRPYFVKAPQAWQTTTSPDSFLEVASGTTYEEAIQFYTGGDIVIRFGRKGNLDWDKDGSISDQEQKRFNDQPGQVEPTCGEIRIPISDRRPTNAANQHATDGFLGTVAMQRFYYELIRDHWHDFARAENYIDFGGRFTLVKGGQFPKTQEYNECSMGCAAANAALVEGADECGTAYPATGSDDRPCAKQTPSVRWRQEAVNTMQTALNTQMDTVWVDYNTGTNEFNMDPAILDRGWGGAGIWFNRLAQVNGSFVDAQLNSPSYDVIPKVMKAVSEQKKQKDNEAVKCEAYNPNASPQGGKIVFAISTDQRVAIVLYRVGCYWTNGSINEAKPGKDLDSNILKQGMNLIFGTYGLFAMTERNANIHPLAQLVTMGKGLVEATVRNIAGSTLFAVGGGLAAALGAQGGSGLGDTASSFLSSTAFIGLTAGVVLFYILPFLPFVYFYFAVASWVKTIFEAMVGVPLWALAHLRLDGDGLPGESAANGYFLIFEIFVRPVLSIAGLVAAMIIFTAQVRVLNFIWLLVTENVGGHDGDPTIGFAEIEFKRGVIDEFFYTVVYAIICYILATTAFKLIDKIPDNILRWMGQGVSSFGDINSDPTESLTKYAALGGLTAGQQIVGGINTAGRGLGQAIAAGKNTGQSDRNLKEDIEYLGLENGIPVYAFNYIGEAERYKGVMAQDILAIMPEAVHTLNGYLAVDYDMIGIKMERIDALQTAGGRKA